MDSQPTNPLDRGIEFIKQAIEADEQKNYHEAYQLYSYGLDYLMLTLKHEKNPKSQRLLRIKINEYLTRAESLKKHTLLLQTSSSPNLPTATDKSTDNDICADPFQRGRQFGEKALQKDKEHDYPSAISLYEDSIDFLSISLRQKKDPEVKRLLEQEINGHTTRIKILKGYLKNKPSFESPSRSNRHFSRALDIVQEAFSEDTNHNYSKALLLYLNALDCFMLTLKYMENGTNKTKILDKVKEYSARADRLQSYLNGDPS